MRQKRYATLVNAPMIFSGLRRGVRFQPTRIEVVYELKSGHWFPLRFQPVRVETGAKSDPFHPYDARNLRRPEEGDWYLQVVAALTPEPGLPEFDIETENV